MHLVFRYLQLRKAFSACLIREQKPWVRNNLKSLLTLVWTVTDIRFYGYSVMADNFPIYLHFTTKKSRDNIPFTMKWNPLLTSESYNFLFFSCHERNSNHLFRARENKKRDKKIEELCTKVFVLLCFGYCLINTFMLRLVYFVYHHSKFFISTNFALNIFFQNRVSLASNSRFY